jgi:hypothetical protein
VKEVGAAAAPGANAGERDGGDQQTRVSDSSDRRWRSGGRGESGDGGEGVVRSKVGGGILFVVVCAAVCVSVCGVRGCV